MENQNLVINTNEKRITINGDASRVIVFNPSDVLFAERFYNLMGEFQAKLENYRERSTVLEQVTAKDLNGLPINLSGRIELVKEACKYICERIDELFGKGTSKIAFGSAMELDMFTQFFDGIAPFIKDAREAKVNKYSNPIVEKKSKHKRK